MRIRVKRSKRFGGLRKRRKGLQQEWETETPCQLDRRQQRRKEEGQKVWQYRKRMERIVARMVKRETFVFMFLCFFLLSHFLFYSFFCFLPFSPLFYVSFYLLPFSYLMLFVPFQSFSVTLLIFLRRGGDAETENKRNEGYIEALVVQEKDGKDQQEW